LRTKNEKLAKCAYASVWLFERDKIGEERTTRRVHSDKGKPVWHDVFEYHMSEEAAFNRKLLVHVHGKRSKFAVSSFAGEVFVDLKNFKNYKEQKWYYLQPSSHFRSDFLCF
jgi:hypothetical protein